MLISSIVVEQEFGNLEHRSSNRIVTLQYIGMGFSERIYVHGIYVYRPVLSSLSLSSPKQTPSNMPDTLGGTLII